MRLNARLPLALILVLLVIGLVPMAVGAGPSGASPSSPYVGFSPASGPVGTSVAIHGTGWRKHRGETFTLQACTPDGPVVATATVQRDGTFAFPAVTIPSAGLHWAYFSTYCVFSVRNGGTMGWTHWWPVTG
jgi:hypothetical protein